MMNRSQEILHHLGTQKDATLCLKCTKIRLAAGLCPDPLGDLPTAFWINGTLLFSDHKFTVEFVDLVPFLAE